jgi:threonine/homoserine/homoserine lactone efflux protein
VHVVQLLLAGVALGAVLAAQVGPVTLLIVRSVMRGGRALAVGIAMAGAVALVDVLYAALGLAGAGSLLGAPGLRLALGLASAALLVVIGARTLWRGLRARTGLETDDEVVTPRRAFATAVAATALNPLTIALWTISFPVAAPAASTGSASAGVAVLCGVAVGTLGWYVGFAVAVACARRRLGGRLRAVVDVAVGVALLGLGAHLGQRAIRETR